MIKFLTTLCILVGIALSLNICAAKDDTISINFRDTDISLVIEAVAKLTNKNFLVSPKVKGNVTIVSSANLESDNLYEVFLSILDVYGYSTIEGQGLTKIVPIKQARQSASNDRMQNDYSRVTRVMKLKYVKASEVISILRPLVSPYAQIAALRNGNSVIVHDTEINVNRIQSIVKQVDTIQAKDFTILPIEYADANDIANVIKSFYSNHKDISLLVEVDKRVNSLVIVADKKVVASILDLINKLDKPVANQGGIEIVYLQYAKAKDITPIIEKILGTPFFLSINQKSSANKSSKTKRDIVKPYEAMNALIISGSAESIKAIKNIIRKLDIPRAQVLIEAIIVEVEVDKVNEIGVDVVAHKADELLGGTSVDPNGIVNGLLAGTATSLPAGASMAFGEITSSADKTGWLGLLRALNTNNKTNVLATPSIITLDNETATIVVGENISVITGTTTTSGIQTTNTERKDVGTKLTVTPQVNRGSAIVLDIEQEASSVKEGDGGAFKTKSITTKVLAKNQQLIVLGGLINEEQEEQESVIPFFGDLPLIGWMFRYVKTSTAKKSLVLFLRPTIIADDTIASSISHGKYNSIRAKQLMMKESNSFGQDVAPLLDSLGLSKAEIERHVSQLSTTDSNDTKNSEDLLESSDRLEMLKEAVKNIQRLD